MLFAVALPAGSTALRQPWSATADPASADLLAFGALLIVAIAETGRIPIDNPDTHLELTMVHEGMLLEYSGRPLGVLLWATQVKQLVMLALLAALFLPWGMADRARGHSRRWRSVCSPFACKAGAARAGARRRSRPSFAKLRIFRAPDLLGVASVLGVLAVHVDLRGGAVGWRGCSRSRGPSATIDAVALGLIGLALLGDDSSAASTRRSGCWRLQGVLLGRGRRRRRAGRGDVATPGRPSPSPCWSRRSPSRCSSDRCSRRIALRREVETVVPLKLAFPLGVGLVLLAYSAIGPFTLGVVGDFHAPNALPAAAGAAAARSVHDGDAQEGAHPGHRAGDDGERALPGRRRRDRAACPSRSSSGWRWTC